MTGQTATRTRKPIAKGYPMAEAIRVIRSIVPDNWIVEPGSHASNWLFIYRLDHVVLAEYRPDWSKGIIGPRQFNSVSPSEFAGHFLDWVNSFRCNR